jgi:Pentapeptide repeats (8 copies)
MASKFGTWRQKIQQHLFIVIGIIVPLIMFLAFALAVHWWGWDWTGLGPYFAPPDTKGTDFPRGRTLWDWLNLLIVPIMLGIGGFWLNALDKNRDKRAAEQQYKTDREIAADNQREAEFQAYLEKMAEFILEKNLRDSLEDDEVRKIARARTLAVLRRLDAVRKGLVIQGLYDLDLISKDKSIISLNGAHFSGAHLKEANLSKVNLSGAHLREADLSKANLSEAHLSEASLSGADLTLADLSRANLEGAIGVTVEELKKQAASLEGAIMPDGSIHP